MDERTQAHASTIGDFIESVRKNGAPMGDFGALNAVARVFHLPGTLVDDFGHYGEDVQIFDELEHAVFPFDCFTIDITDPATYPFVDAATTKTNLTAYRARRYYFARIEVAGFRRFLVGDLCDNISGDRVVDQLASFGLFLETPYGDGYRQLEFEPTRPSVLPPHAIKMDALKQNERETGYFGKLLVSFTRFAILLNHKRTAIERIDDPLRPPNRQQRRAAGYVEREHYRITLRGNLTLTQGLTDVMTGQSLRYTPRRRHAVETFERTYRSGKTGPVRAHLRGGKLAPGPDYDARVAILAAATDRRASNASGPAT